MFVSIHGPGFICDHWNLGGETVGRLLDQSRFKNEVFVFFCSHW